MMRTDIIRLYKEGIAGKWPDDKRVSYKHYLAGETACNFKYVKELYTILDKEAHMKVNNAHCK